jgi:methylmalonyl-CoA mutase N-terminal domain/subunit
MWECLESGWLKQLAENSCLKVENEIANGKRLIVGVNSFPSEEGPLNKAIRRIVEETFNTINE